MTTVQCSEAELDSRLISKWLAKPHSQELLQNQTVHVLTSHPSVIDNKSDRIKVVPDVISRASIGRAHRENGIIFITNPSPGEIELVSSYRPAKRYEVFITTERIDYATEADLIGLAIRKCRGIENKGIERIQIIDHFTRLSASENSYQPENDTHGSVETNV